MTDHERRHDTREGYQQCRDCSHVVQRHSQTAGCLDCDCSLLGTFRG